MTTYRLWPATSGPSTPVNYAGNFISGTTFCVTGEAWFEGYYWWVANLTGGSDGFQPTTATKCALWQRDHNGGVHLVPGSVVTSGTLTAGAWNYIPLATPIPLSLGGSTGMTPSINGGADGNGIATYIAAIGCNGPFPDTNNYWGSGQTKPAGITNGPLTAFSAQSGTMPAPNSLAQGVFSTAGTDPSTTCPTVASNTDNFWVDVQVSDYSGAPAGASLRLWPSFPEPATVENNDTNLNTSATAFTLSVPCKLSKIWFYSPTGSTGLATRVGIWDTGAHTEVSGTDNSSPSWKDPGGGAASAGDGWIYVDYSGAGVLLAAGNYAVAFYNGSGLKIYFDSFNYFFSGTTPGSTVVAGPGWNGVSWGSGILTAPNVAGGPSLVYDDSSGTKAGQSQYSGITNTGWQYPSEFEASNDWGETRWADVEVIPTVTHSASATLTVTASRTVTATSAHHGGTVKTFTANRTAVAGVTRHRTDSRPVTATITASAKVIRSRSAARTTTATITAAGTLGGFHPAAATRAETATITAHGTATHLRGDTRAVTATITASATKHPKHLVGASRLVTATITAAATNKTHRRTVALSIAVTLAATAVNISAIPPPPPPVTDQGGSWWQLLDIIKNDRAERAYWDNQPPRACPNDGTPLVQAPPDADGCELFCPHDGWQYPGDWRPGMT